MNYYVYKHLDENNKVIYVGLTTDMKNRQASHKSTALWRDKIKSVEYCKVENSAIMNIFEIYLINKLNPEYNIKDKNNDNVDILDGIFHNFTFNKYINKESKGERKVDGVAKIKRLELIHRKVEKCNDWLDKLFEVLNNTSSKPIKVVTRHGIEYLLFRKVGSLNMPEISTHRYKLDNWFEIVKSRKGKYKTLRIDIRALTYVIDRFDHNGICSDNLYNKMSSFGINIDNLEADREKRLRYSINHDKAMKIKNDIEKSRMGDVYGIWDKHYKEWKFKEYNDCSPMKVKSNYRNGIGKGFYDENRFKIKKITPYNKNDNIDSIFWDDKLDFGKHSGRLLRHVPIDYVKWMSKNGFKLSGDVIEDLK